MRKVYVILLLMLSVVVFVSCGDDDSSPTAPTVARNGWPIDRSPEDYMGTGYEFGEQAPNFVASDQHGNTDVELTQFYGATVILHFTCTWGPFCIQNETHLQATADSLNGLYGSAMTFWVLDVFDSTSAIDAAVAKAWADEYGIEFPVLFGPDINTMATEIGMSGYPRTLILDPELRVQDDFTGGSTSPTQLVPRARAVADAYLGQ